MKKKLLFEKFTSTKDKDLWKIEVLKDLKGKPLEKIYWNTPDNLVFEPYYKQEVLKDYDYLLTSEPNNAPFLRGSKELDEENNWTICQEITNKEISVAKKNISKATETGVDSISIVLSSKKDGKGILVENKEQFSSLLNDFDLNNTKLNILADKESNTLDFAYHFAEYYMKNPLANNELLKGSIANDPVNKFITIGKLEFNSFEEMFEKYFPFKNFHSVIVDVNPYHESGASIVQEVAIALTTGVEYLSKLTEKYKIEDIAGKIRFKMPVGSHYFMEIAKFRATRFLWSKIVESYDVKDDNLKKAYIHANTSNYNKTIYDTNVNMLRVTSEAMSAVIGGVEELTILPYDNTINNEADEFSLRIARNVQHLIKDECKLNKIADPAGGSYYIEKITDEIISKAWELFNTIEDKGGIVEVIKSGFIQEEIKAVRNKREKDISFRKQTIVGTNQYPNSLDLKSSGINKTDDEVKSSDTKILTPKRASEDFERLRFKTEKFNKENNKEVTAFLATLGNLTMRKARASFSADFLGAGGFKVIDNNGFSDYNKAFTEFKKSKAEIIVICSSDDDYKEFAEDFAKLIKKESPNTIIILAGYPKDLIKPLEEIGIDHFINVKSNLLEVIEKIQQKIMEN